VELVVYETVILTVTPLRSNPCETAVLFTYYFVLRWTSVSHLRGLGCSLLCQEICRYVF